MHKKLPKKAFQHSCIILHSHRTELLLQLFPIPAYVWYYYFKISVILVELQWHFHCCLSLHLQLIILNEFSGVYWPFKNLLQIVFSRFFAQFLMEVYLFIDLLMFFFYSGCNFYVGYTYCNYTLPSCGLGIDSISSISSLHKFFYFNEL